LGRGRGGLFGEDESLFGRGRLREIGLEASDFLAMRLDLFRKLLHLRSERNDAVVELVLLFHGILNQVGNVNDVERLERGSDHLHDELRVLIDRKRSQKTNDVADAMSACSGMFSLPLLSEDGHDFPPYRWRIVGPSATSGAISPT
jgi:hypothetical protein